MELKARAEKQDCKKRLETIAGEGAAFVKTDSYWFPAGEFSGRSDKGLVRGGGPQDNVWFQDSAWLFRSGLRVRREKKAGKETVLVTWKRKEKRNGMEINDERECRVSDGTLFEELLYALGLRKKIAKRKEGWAWNISGVTAELAEVSGFVIRDEEAKTPDAPKGGISDPPEKRSPETLGWFLELEILDGDGETAARRRLLDTLEKAGLGEANIENRYYSELLAAPRAGRESSRRA
jgi:adenylate cyclase class 2